MMSRFATIGVLRAAAGSASVALLLAGTAGAHGPCGCLPRTAVPDERFVLNNVFRAVWNPTREDIYYRQPALVAAHVNGTPRVVLLDRPRRDARTRATLRVPDVPAGRYLVLLYDGTEGGRHYTWGSVAVRHRPVKTSPPSRAAASQGGGFPTLPVAAAAALLVAAVASLLALRKGRRPNGRFG